jgi:hypothetical protein
VDKDIRTMLIKDDAPPAKKLGVKVWPNAIPQVTPVPLHAGPSPWPIGSSHAA